VFITVLGGLVMVWYTYRMESLFTEIIGTNMAAFQTSAALENALVNQKGFVSYYFQDGDPDWLRQLGEYRQIFKERLKEAKSTVATPRQKEAVARLETEYNQYVALKDQVIEHYKAGERDTGAELHKRMRNHFFKVLALSEDFKNLHAALIKAAAEKSRTQAKNLRAVAASAVLAALFLGILLAFVFVHNVLNPLRRLTLEAGPENKPENPADEMTALSRSVRGLIHDRDLTQSKLEKSRETLLQAEKMALVGKLAAGMAHSIRNPLTSVKMRLFSLNRTLELSIHQREDFEVISDEIRHIDTIVQNFLEFSRPPKLKVQKISPSEVVDLVLQLLRHRLDSYGVQIKIHRDGNLPRIYADPEQLKEVLVNLIENACQAMDGGGAIEIHEEEATPTSLARSLIIRVSDRGPGIPDSIKEKVIQPFFSTKEEGTGLGLSIAARIVEEHGGTLGFTSKEGEGTTFTITLPLKEPNSEPSADHR